MAPALDAKRRTLAFGYEGEHFTLEEWLALLEFNGHLCLRCGTRENLSMDHVIPVSLEGSNSIENIQPLCERCNSLKSDTVADYRPSHSREGCGLA